MSIATELQNLNDNILDAYDTVQAKGGTVPANKNMANLDTAINSIPSPGKYDVKKRVDSYNTLRQGYQVPADYSGTEVTAIGKLALAYIYSYANGAGVKNVSFPNVTTIYEGGMQCAFGSSAYDSYTGAGVETINFDSLQEVRTYGLAQAFLGCRVKTVSFPALTTVGSNAFYGTFSSSSAVGGTVSFPALTNIPSSATSAFQSAFSRFPYGTSQTNGYVSFSFPNLVTVAAEKAFYFGFQDNNLCTSLDFSSLTTISGASAFENAFNGIPIPDLSVVFPELVTASGSNCLARFAPEAVVACLPKLKTAGGSAFYYAFRGNTTTTISFPELDTLTGTAAFNQVAYGDSALTTVSFPKLVDIPSGMNSTFSNAFNGCTSLSSADFSGLENILAQYTFSSAFSGCTSITKIGAPSSVQDVTVDLSSLETINSGRETFRETFSGCTSLATAEFPALTTVSGSSSSVSQDVFYRTFNGCTSLTTVAFPALTEASAYYAFRQAFYGASALTTVTFPLLSVVGTASFQNAFEGCSSLLSVSFPSLVEATQSCFTSAFTGCTSLTTANFGISIANNYSFNNAFSGCTALTTVSFPNLTSARSNSSFASMLTGCSNVTVHFPSAMETTMSSWTDVRNGFGGTNTTVLFDL